MARRLFIGGNWKCNGTKAKITEMCQMFNEPSVSSTAKNADVVVSCPAPYLEHTHKSLPNYILVAAQNCYKANSGAFTGEISPVMISDCGAKWVIIGHSERRQLFKESDLLIAEKIAFAIENQLSVIACIGETLQERESGHTFDVVHRQLKAIVDKVPNEQGWSKIVIAYEPVWAIGTGKVASKEQAQEVHANLREWMSKTVSQSVAKSVRIIYGGSVTGDNCRQLIHQEDIDGFLVGGASLRPDFVKIINCQQRSRPPSPSGRRTSSSSKTG
ncbi:Triosephosphate isomerase, partial [Fragariocoptes setiger]